MTRSETSFGSISGTEIKEYRVENGHGYSFACMSYGATLISFKAPGSGGRPMELTLGYDSLEPYVDGHPFLGSTVGRVANRIGGARYTYQGKTWNLNANENGATLHGGAGGFHQKIWTARAFARDGQAGVIFHTTSEDGDQGFPGTVGVTVTYSLTENDELVIEYQAESDQSTPLNLTNHTYWNLAGAADLRRASGAEGHTEFVDGGAVGDHVLSIFGGTYVEQGEGQIPTGRLLDASGTPFDFRSPKPIGQEISAAGGYDLCYVLEPCDEDLCPAALISDPGSNRRMEIQTTYPTVQFYTSEKLEGTRARGGQSWKRRDAFCLETQYHPDALNHEHFPSIILQPDEVYQHKTVHRFSS